MRIASVLGARPQFIKSAMVSKAIAEAGYQEYVIHTGQHYDYEMSQVFFEELEIAEPIINLGVGSGSHGQQTGQMLVEIEPILLNLKPDIVLVYGDTNSTLAGALAAVKMQIRLAHIEAGLRSFNRQMPEEHNRVLTDHCADLLFCPTQTAIENLAQEGLSKNVYMVGDTMLDAVLYYSNVASQRSRILQILSLQPKDYLLATVHRAGNVDRPEILAEILSAFGQVKETLIFPMHPRTLSKVKKWQIPIAKNIRVIEPVGYYDMLTLEQNSRLILTDSGGIQKEAYFLSVPCLTLRHETEWVETTHSGMNVLVGSDQNTILSCISSHHWPTEQPDPVFGTGQASQAIVDILSKTIQNVD